MAGSDGLNQNIQLYFEEGVRVFMRKSYAVTLSGNSVTVTTCMYVQHTEHTGIHKKFVCVLVCYQNSVLPYGHVYVQYDKILGNLH